MPKLLSASDRLNLLLPWLNGAALSPDQVHKLLRTFIGSFDGSGAAGHIEVYHGESEPWVPEFIRGSTQARHGRQPDRDHDFGTRAEQDEHANEELRLYLVDLLRKGFWPAAEPVGPWVAELPSLKFGVRGAQRIAPGKLSRASSAERRAYVAPGAYVLLVDGTVRDLIVFLVAHLLTAPGMTSVARCPAPARYSTQRCGHFLITTGRGRPRIFCSEACGVRNHAEQVQEQIRRARPRAAIRTRRRK